MSVGVYEDDVKGIVLSRSDDSPASFVTDVIALVAENQAIWKNYFGR